MKTVLVVDDNAVCRELIREALQTEGLCVTEASHGAEALEAIQRLEPDMILLDIQMPNGTGYEVLRKIRSDPRTARLPVAALTAFAMRGDREKGISEGFDDYITKPIDLDSLRHRVRRLLGQSRSSVR
jgi:two-component system, cell cycle response regulator DivK